MSYRNPGVIKTPVAGEGMGAAIANAAAEIGGAMIARKKEIEEENKRIEERKAQEDAAELARFNDFQEQSLEDKKAFVAANTETKTNYQNDYETSMGVEERLMTESEADGLTIEERKNYSAAIYKEKEKRQNMLQAIGDIGAAKSAAMDWEGDINFTSDKGEAFYQWSKDLKSDGSTNPWKLTPGENNTSTLSNGSASHTFDNKDIATFKFGVNTPEVFQNSDKMIADLNADLKKRAFDSDTATPQVLGEIRTTASQAGKTVQSELRALSGVDKTAFLAGLKNKMGFSDDDVSKYEEMIYSGDAEKLTEAFTAINLKVQQRVDLATAASTGLTLNDKNEFVKEERPIKFDNPASGGTKEWTLETEKKDLIKKTKLVNKDNYLEILNLKDGTIPVDKTKWDLKTTINGNNITISKVNPDDKVKQYSDKLDADGKKVLIGEAPVEVQLSTYNLAKKSDVMSFLRNQHKYAEGTYTQLSDLADAIVKAVK
jgi:hypothetical protein